VNWAWGIVVCLLLAVVVCGFGCPAKAAVLLQTKNMRWYMFVVVHLHPKPAFANLSGISVYTAV
jgi:hypothetical protein